MSDFTKGVEFHPEFAHQIFGERFEEVESSSSSSDQMKYIFIGYMTVYKFYAYPKNLRPRLSQVFVLPPFRNQGHATELLQTFYRDFQFVPQVIDIAVEDPSDEFRRIRDFLDCKRCLEQPEIMELLKYGYINGTARNGVSKLEHQTSYIKFRATVQKCLKINRCQAKRVFEILHLYLNPRTEEACDAFRNRLKDRTLKNYQRARGDIMCGRTPAPAQNGEPACNNESSSNEQQQQQKQKLGQHVFDALMDECYKSQIDEQVTTEMEAYQAVVDKLDTRLTKLSTSNGSGTPELTISIPRVDIPCATIHEPL